MPRPNIVLILTDTQATNVIGAYGRPELRTPNIDRLAQAGVKFERAYTTCPVCTPARAGLFTGLYPHTAGAWTNNLPLGTNIQTLGQRFQDHGYRSAYIGKWHLDGHDYFGAGICPPGWEPAYWYDGRNYLDELTPEQVRLWRSGLNTPAQLRAHQIQPEFTWAQRVTDRALDFLSAASAASEASEASPASPASKANPDKPFLLVVSYDEPHHPFTCPPEFAEAFQDFDYDLGPAAFDSLEHKPAHQREWAAAARVQTVNGKVRQPLYFGCNSFVDSQIGRVVAAVQARASENTVLIFTSDHGDMLGAHRLNGKGAAMYEEITHIPLIVQLPGEPRPGRVCQTPVSHVDLLPSLLELAQLPAPPILEGESLVRLLDGAEDPQRGAVIEFNRYEIEHDSFGGYQPIRCLVLDDYKLVLNLLSSDELYDLRADPAELLNLIDAPSAAAARDALHDCLLDWMDAKRDPFRGYYWERRPWRTGPARRQWMGFFRPRPADGYAPEVRDYDTGLPNQGVKVEHAAKPPA